MNSDLKATVKYVALCFSIGASLVSAAKGVQAALDMSKGTVQVNRKLYDKLMPKK